MSTENPNQPVATKAFSAQDDKVSAEAEAAQYSQKLMSAALMDSAPDLNFDLQMSWLRRLTSDVDSNFKAFAKRLKEALPDRITTVEKRPFLFGEPKLIGLSVDMGEKRYILEMVNGRLEPKVAMIVRGITLNTKHLDLAQWIAQLVAESQKATDEAKRLSESLSNFLS